MTPTVVPSDGRAAAMTDRVSGLAVATAASRLLGFVRTSVWAAAFGLHVVGDALTLANTLPTIIYMLLAGGAISSVFVPQLMRAAERGQTEGDAFAGRLLGLVLLVLVPATVVGALLAPWIAWLYTGGRWPPRDTALLAGFLMWCLPQIPLYGVFAVLGQVLLARDRPGPMTWAPIANNMVGIAAALPFLMLAGVDTGPGTEAADTVSAVETAAIAGGATAGVAAQVLILLPMLRASGISVRPRLDLRSADVGRSLRLAGWTLVFVAANQVAYSVTAVAANAAGAAADGGRAAGLAQYTNAYMIMLVPHAVIAVSVVTAAFPGMTRSALDGDRAGVARASGDALVRSGRLLLPAAFGLLMTAPLITRLLFPGNSGPDTWFMGAVLATFAPCVVLYSFQFVLVRTLHAVEDTRGPAIIQIVVAAVQSVAALAASLLLPAEFVVLGLGASFTVAYTVGLICTARLVVRKTGHSPLRHACRLLVRSAVASSMAAVVTGGLVTLTGAGPGSDLWHTALILIGAVGTFAAVFVAASGHLTRGRR